MRRRRIDPVIVVPHLESPAMSLRHALCLSLLTAVSTGALARSVHIPPAKPSTNYPIVVSFISIGEGVSPAAISQFNLVLAEHEQVWGVTAGYAIARWGREGEYDACFTLAGLPQAAADDLVDILWQLDIDADVYISVAQNAPCGH
jgi:hypothetical protein